MPLNDPQRAESLHSDDKEKGVYNDQPVYLTNDASPDHRSEDETSPQSKFAAINAGFDEQEVLRVRKKVDRRLLPILGALYSIALIDRTNLSAARIAGAGKDLNLEGDTNYYSIATLMFFVPYIIFEMPSNLLLRRIGAAKQLGTIALLWGGVMIGQGFVNNWQQLTVTRTLTGLFEAGFFPACVLLISTWYVRRESQVRMSFFYLISVGFSGFSNIIAYGIAQMQGQAGLAGWRWIFIIEGIATCVLALFAYFLILDFPDRAVEKGFLEASERDLILTRIQRDRGDAEHDPLTWRKAVSYMADPKPWLYGLMFMCTTMPTYAYAYFLPVILRGMGYSVRDAFLLGAAPYVSAMIFAFAFAVASDRLFVRTPIIIAQNILTIIGLGLLFMNGNRAAQLVGAFFGVAGANGNIPAVLNFSQNNIAGQSKRSYVSVVVVSFGGIGGIFASTAFRGKDAPFYRTGLYATLACQSFCVLCAAGLAVYFHIVNKQVRAGKRVVEGKPGFTYTI